MALVIDTSVTLVWCFEDEATYDATYLELAARRGLPLATRDQRLTAAAERLGVPLFEDGP